MRAGPSGPRGDAGSAGWASIRGTRAAGRRRRPAAVRRWLRSARRRQGASGCCGRANTAANPSRCAAVGPGDGRSIVGRTLCRGHPEALGVPPGLRRGRGCGVRGVPGVLGTLGGSAADTSAARGPDRSREHRGSPGQAIGRHRVVGTVLLKLRRSTKCCVRAGHGIAPRVLAATSARCSGLGAPVGL